MSETLIGYEALKARLARLAPGSGLGRDLMGTLQGLAVAETKKALYEQVTRRTGQSGANIVRGTLTDSSAQIIARSTAAYIETGTKPHDIVPRFKQALFFSASGAGTRATGAVRSAFRGIKGAQAAAKAGVQTVFAKRVHHPGTKEHPYMITGAQRAIVGAGVADRIVAAWEGHK